MKKIKEMIKKNEKEFGKEMREKYDESIIQESYAHLNGMNKETLEQINHLTEKLMSTLKEAYMLGNPASELARQVCVMHKEWICMFWPDGLYTPKSHLALVESYLYDERFIAFYDQIGQGCTQFLFEAMKLFYQ